MEKKGKSTKSNDKRDRKRDSTSSYEQYLLAMKRVHRHSARYSINVDLLSPRERYRLQKSPTDAADEVKGNLGTVQQMQRIGIISSMVPDEIVYKHYDHSIRSYETALMFIDISGFTDLCENYTKAGCGGPSRLTQVLNSYIGAMVQEILTHNGDVLKFSGDAFLSMWKKTASLSMQDVVHTAIDCGLILQKNYGTYHTDAGVVLKVKIAISAGVSHFSIIADDTTTQSHYVIVGQPVWDVKKAEYKSTAGDVLTAASAWRYVNEAEYCTQPCGDGRHTKVLGVGATWKRVEKASGTKDASESLSNLPMFDDGYGELNLREYSLRPAVLAAMQSSWWPGLRRFMLAPVLRAVDNDEPMDFLTEVRRVVVVFINIITAAVNDRTLIGIVDNAYKCVSSASVKAGGLVNKVSMFDKDMMFLVVFGLRGLKHEDEACKALQCASQLKESLTDSNITSVSVGVTSGTAYCGVVGHCLRREYTVIGPAVNKAARIMIAYNNIVTCDKETFLRSKLDQEFFRLAEDRPLKGIVKPGPIYEFNGVGWTENRNSLRHPILGRNEEMCCYKNTLKLAMEQHQQSFSKYKDHKYAVVFMGPKSCGKTRLLEECINVTPNFVRTDCIKLTNDDKGPYGLLRHIVAKRFPKGKDVRSARASFENRIRSSIDMSNLKPLQIYAINTIFDCRFPLPEYYRCTEDFLLDPTVKRAIKDVFINSTTFCVLAIDEAQYTDDSSWRILLLILETKTIFFIITITEGDITLSTVATQALSSGMIVKIPLSGIDRWYHAALTCQLLDVQAIPSDLQKVIESASGGLPGWIQNFVISLIQRGALTVVTTTRGEAAGAGAVMPPLSLLHSSDANANEQAHGPSTAKRPSYQSIFSLVSAGVLSKRDSTFSLADTDTLQMAVLSDSFSFDDMKDIDITMDVVILKTYDSLTPFEKMLLKCSSVLGDVFSRDMLLHLMQSDSTRKVAEAVAKLFAIRVLECEGGDFTRDTSMVLVHPAPSIVHVAPPYCACLGIRQPPNCRDLPMYAFCGYMKFKHPLFRTTTYELLTERQKHDMHARGLLYLERYTRRCFSCGSGCFSKLLGLRCNDGLIEDSEDLSRTRQQIRALSAETRVGGGSDGSDFKVVGALDDSEEGVFRIPFAKRSNPSNQNIRRDKRVRSFSSLDLDKCECLVILVSVYCQIIDHCRGAGEHEKLFEAYLEYAEISIMNLNLPQAVRLLFEVENFVQNNNIFTKNVYTDWIKEFHLARIYSLRGSCMIEAGDLSEAKKHLLHTLVLLGHPFPSSKYWVKMKDLQVTARMMTQMYIAPNCYVGTCTGYIGRFYEEIAKALHKLSQLFMLSKEPMNASLAAKQCLNYALLTNSDLRLLSNAYAGVISVCRQKQDFSLCLKLEKRAMEACHRKRGRLDVTEVQAVCYLYTCLFLFYVEYGRKMESLEFGLSVMHMMTNFIDLSTREMMTLWMLRLLLSELRLHDMVAIMREFFISTEHYDLSSETWYYQNSIIILLDTGYCVNSYGDCERFYIKKGDAILRSQTPEAAWNFFVCMWLVTIRIGAWERSILWEEKIKKLLVGKMEKHEYTTMFLVRLVEGLIITLVREMDNRNIKKILLLEKTVTSMFKDIKSGCKQAPMYRARYSILQAYFSFIRGKKRSAYNYLGKASDQCVQLTHSVLMIWIEHTRKHWRGTLSPKYVDYWTEHIEPDNLLDYKQFDEANVKIIPFTLPLPRDLQIN